MMAAPTKTIRVEVAARDAARKAASVTTVTAARRDSTLLTWYKVYRIVTNGIQIAWAGKNVWELFVSEVSRRATDAAKQKITGSRPRKRSVDTADSSDDKPAASASSSDKPLSDKLSTWRTRSSDNLVLYVIILFLLDVPVTKKIAPRRLTTAFIAHHIFGLTSAVGVWWTRKCHAHFNLAMLTEIYPLLLYIGGVLETVVSDSIRNNVTPLNDVAILNKTIINNRTALQSLFTRIAITLKRSAILSIPLCRLPVWILFAVRAWRSARSFRICKGGSFIPICLDLYWLRGHMRDP
jgi:hypothetical protein